MNANHRIASLALVISLPLVAGCGNESSATKAGADTVRSSSQSGIASQPAAPRFAPPPPQFAPPPGANIAGSAAPKASSSSTAPGDEPPPGMIREVAKAGVTGKGGYEEGVLAPWTTPLNAYWSAKESAYYDIAIPRAMQLFEFEKQRKPASHDEFMREIIRKNNFKLPELPPGVRYVYDPKRGRLMVERPGEPESPPK